MSNFESKFRFGLQLIHIVMHSTHKENLLAILQYDHANRHEVDNDNCTPIMHIGMHEDCFLL